MHNSRQFLTSFWLSLNTEQILWTFSILLESIAILPQLWMLLKHGETVEVRILIVTHFFAFSQHTIYLKAQIDIFSFQLLTAHYIASLGGYRALYLLNWIVRAIMEEDYWHPLIWFCGLVQNGLYVDFFIKTGYPLI